MILLIILTLIALVASIYQMINFFKIKKNFNELEKLLEEAYKELEKYDN